MMKLWEILYLYKVNNDNWVRDYVKDFEKKKKKKKCE